MMFNSKMIALFGALASTTLAADVYSEFLDANGNQLPGTPSYDISNAGCFSPGSAASVSFTQSGNTHTANGPYCLTGFSEGGCTGNAASQQFSSIVLNNGQAYGLASGLNGAASFRWSANGC